MPATTTSSEPQPEAQSATATGVIRTPDQRLRVFVSSSMRELAAERRAVRRAVDQLHLVPVTFEMSARPHPARELYRAYLAQSQVFSARRRRRRAGRLSPVPDPPAGA